MSTDDFAVKRIKGGKATAAQKKKYHKPNKDKTPSIDGSFAFNKGPQRVQSGKSGFGPKVWCYVHDEPHSLADRPTPFGKEPKKPKGDL